MQVVTQGRSKSLREFVETEVYYVIGTTLGQVYT